MAQTAGGGLLPLIAIDRGGEKPLHRQIYDGYRAAILAGGLQPGQQVPSSRSLADDLGVSRIPVLDAYAQLLAEGYFEARQGSGTFVSTALATGGIGHRSQKRDSSRSPSNTRPTSRRSLAVANRDTAPWLGGRGAFSVGMLAFEHFPFTLWANLVARHARKAPVRSLNYGDPMGLRELRDTIAAYLKTARAVQCDASQIMVVSGSQQALDICARVLLDPGDAVWVEEPGYQFMLYALSLAGAEIVPIPVDDEGLNVGAGAKKAPHAAAAYVTPSHQYPLGMTMSAARRLELLQWATRHNMWILEDDYDSEYRYGSMPVSSLQGLDQDSRVIYIGTFSKTLFPSLRLGYIVIPPGLVDSFAAVRRASDLCGPSLYQSVLNEFINEGHFARHVRKTRMVYKERRGVLVDALEQELGPEFQILGAEAGMHVVLTLPSGVQDRNLSLEAAKQGLWLWPLSSAYVGKAARQGLILGFGSVKTGEVPQSVKRLRHVLGI